jgi:hypothetical protein
MAIHLTTDGLERTDLAELARNHADRQVEALASFLGRLERIFPAKGSECLLHLLILTLLKRSNPA